MKNIIVTILFLAVSFNSFSQEKKQEPVKRPSVTKPKKVNNKKKRHAFFSTMFLISCPQCKVKQAAADQEK